MVAEVLTQHVCWDLDNLREFAQPQHITNQLVIY